MGLTGCHTFVSSYSIRFHFLSHWQFFLGNTYNVTDTKIFNLAYGGATIDSKLVTPYLPTVL